MNFMHKHTYNVNIHTQKNHAKQVFLKQLRI